MRPKMRGLFKYNFLMQKTQCISGNLRHYFLVYSMSVAGTLRGLTLRELPEKYTNSSMQTSRLRISAGMSAVFALKQNRTQVFAFQFVYDLMPFSTLARLYHSGQSTTQCSWDHQHQPLYSSRNGLLPHMSQRNAGNTLVSQFKPFFL